MKAKLVIEVPIGYQWLYQCYNKEYEWTANKLQRTRMAIFSFNQSASVLVADGMTVGL